MAQFNEVLVGRFNAALQRFFSMKGGAPSPQLAPELQPIVSLLDPHPEMYRLRDEVLAAGEITVAGVAVKFGIAQLSNPPGSGQLVIVDRVIISHDGAAATYVAVGVGTNLALAGLPVAGGVTFRDFRWGDWATNRVPAAKLTKDNSPPTIFPANVAEVLEAPGSFADLGGLGVVLSPGSAMQVEVETVNVAMHVSFHWRERRFEPSESA